MRVFTKLGLSLLAVMISASVVWAQSFNEFGPKKLNKITVSDAQFDLQFDYPVGVGGGEAGIETDGSYIYTTKWNGGDFYRYGMDGTYIESFTCGAASNVRDLAYDGTYFYGAAANTSLFQMDFGTQTLVSTITAPTDCRALAYNEDDGYFYANNWSSDIVVFDMSGSQISSFAIGASGASYYGFAYDGYSSGAPYLWGYSQTGTTQNDLIQMQLPDGTETGLTFDVGSVAAVGTGIAGGLAISNEFVTGYYTILGTAQNVDIWGLELVQSGSLPDNDVGIQAITAPSSGVNLGNAEVVTVTIKNYGNNPQSNFEVSYTLDGGTPVTETFTGTINSGETADHTFATTVDLSGYGSYTFDACTNLAGDETPDNDCKTKTVENAEPSLCLDGLYSSGCSFGDGLVYWDLVGNTVDPIECGNGDPYDWYHDFTSMVHSFEPGMDYTLTFQVGYASTFVDIWIDFNDDLFLDEDEHILDDYEGAETGVNYEVTITIPADATPGQHIMRYRTNWQSGVAGSCDPYSYGNMCDFTADIGGGGGGNALFADDFDSYNAGEQLACQNPDDWTTWSNAPCGGEDAYVSDAFAYSGSNSVNVVNDNDLVKPFGDEGAYLTTGAYKISFYMYIPTGNDAYWNTLQDFGANNVWGMEAYYDNGTGTLNADNNSSAATWSYPYDTWMYNELNIDLDNDWAQFYIDGVLIYEWQWSVGTSGSNLVQLAANDFYGYQQTNPCSYYFDDYAIEEISNPPTLDPPTNLVATVSDNDVNLTWDAPGGGGGTGEWIQWDDGVNGDDGIGLTGGGTFYVASHWEPADLTAYDGQYLTKISFFPYDNAVAATFTLKVWSGENAGTLLLSQDVASYTAGEWNEVTLDTPVMIDASQEFWFGYELTHPDGENPAGVDAGPAVQFKGDMLSFDAAAWVSMSNEYGLDYNWNLAGYVEGSTDATIATPMVKNSISNPSTGTLAEATGLIGMNKKFNPSSSKALTGYNVYRDGENIANTTETTYTDMDLAAGSYDYYVTAVYDEGESDPSNTVTAEVTGGGGGGVVYEDDFEAYTVGEQLACQNPDDWTTWSVDPCNATEDPYISDAFAHSGTNSVNIVSDNDCVKPIENYTSGAYKMSFYIYVPTGADGYWNTLQDFAGANSQWGMQVYFGLDATGAGSVDAGGAGSGSFTFNYDTWIYNELIVDLDADWAELYIDGDLIVEWVWSTGAFGSNSLNQLGGNNFYGWTGGVNGNSNYYFDDYKLESMSTSPCENFDALTVGGLVAEQLGGLWTTWDGTSATDATVSDTYSNSPNNSFVVDAGTVDLIQQFDNDPIATGQWAHSVYIYVPSGYSGYFNVQSEPTPGVAWVIEYFFDDGGAGHFMVDGVQTDFTYSQDTWFKVTTNFDLDTDLGWVKFDDDMVLEFETTNTIGAIDYYGANSGGDPGAYYDDACFMAGEPIIPPPPPPAPSNLSAESLNGIDIELNWDAPAGGWIQWDDGVNGDDGIGLTGGGTFFVASHWEPADLVDYNGMYLTKISYYHYDNAATATFVLKVWSGANAGTLLLSQDVNSVPAQWNEITLDTPVQIDATQELWFGYEVTHGDGENPAGVDAGPAVQYKGDMLSFDASSWVSMSAEYGLDYNWNLAGFVAISAEGKSTAVPMAKTSVSNPQGTVEVASGFAGGNTKFVPSSSKSLTGYNIYHKLDTDDYSLLTNVTETTYTHLDPGVGTHCYKVTAVYDDLGESDFTNEACETIIGVDEYLADAINVYPNPATDVVNVKSDVQINSVKVYNYAGQVIVNEEVNSMMYQLNTSQYQSGIYFFQIETDEGTISKRIIIQ